MSSTIVQSRPRRAAAIRAKESVQYNKRRREEQEVIKAEKKQRKHKEQQLPGPRVYELSVEIWEIILQNVSPSQLTTLAQVSLPMYAIVTYLPLWRHIWTTAGSLPPPTTRGKCRNHYQVVLKASQRLCEQCFDYCSKNGSTASLPLYVEEQNKEINLCRPCRQHYLYHHPEPDLPDTEDENNENEEQDEEERNHRRHHHHHQQQQRRTRITKGMAMSTFKLHEIDMDNIPYNSVRNPHYRSAAPMRLYERHNVHLYARQIHGGEVGIEAARSKSQSIVATRRKNAQERAKREEQERKSRQEALDGRFKELQLEQTYVHSMIFDYIQSNLGSIEECISTAQERIKRCNLLKTRMEAAGYAYNPKSSRAIGFIFDPSSIDIETTLRLLIQEVIQKQEREERLVQLKTALENHGLVYNANSALCRVFICGGTNSRGDKLTLDSLVQTLMEHTWFCENTVYSMIRSPRSNHSEWIFENDTFVDHSNFSKWDALNQYLTHVVKKNQYQDIKQNENAKGRPPPSLWNQIEKMIPSILKQVGTDFVNDGFFSQPERVSSAMVVDPNHPEEFISDQHLWDMMDEGNKMAMKEEEQQEEKDQVFSTTMKQMMNESDYESFYHYARIALVKKLKNTYCKNAVHQLPEAISNFFEGCRVDPILTCTTYNERKEQFIQKQLPILSKEMNIHSSYLEALLQRISPWTYSYNYNRYS
ncbi:hypothetical protein INT45_005939 [Circinella minor]|uniref:F-box domain-containing protein n=1 Tax=Circinella minor TaxID=1195481 RepID=A0A8H7VP91_9FUNG|nr:hypothetical protein INT45_005939 [Circinella minor]